MLALEGDNVMQAQPLCWPTCVFAYPIQVILKIPRRREQLEVEQGLITLLHEQMKCRVGKWILLCRLTLT
jgi:hypothetical protein